MLNNACHGYFVFNLKGIFNIALVLSNPILCHCPPKNPPKNDICKDRKKCPSPPLSKLNVMEVGSFSLNTLFFWLFCLPACPGQRLNDWEHGKSWLSCLTTINHLTLHLEVVCTRCVKSKEPNSNAGLTASKIFPSHLPCSLLFKSKSGDRIGLAEWVASVEKKICVGSHPAKFVWNGPF